MILDYSNYITQYESYGLNSGARKKDDESIFFHKRGFCPFCNKEIQQVYTKPEVNPQSLLDAELHKVHTVHVCECGWWEHTFYSFLDGINNDEFKDWGFEIDSAILRKFDIASKTVPLDCLQKYITSHNDEIYKIHHKQMEYLVRDILSEHFACEAHVVGKSHDGGIDVIAIESDSSFAIQVKRRTKPGKVESVSGIRELIGAIGLQEEHYEKCMFVTTADHFSPDAIKARDMALRKNKVQQFELIDVHTLISILKLCKTNDHHPWENLIKR